MPQKLALIEWSHLIEDFLDNIGLTLDDYAQRMTGGWLFGYIEALKTAGVETVLFCFSAQIREPRHLLHQPTGATICVLPATKMYRSIRKIILNPYAPNVDEAVNKAKGWQRPWYSFLLQAAPYAATPLRQLYKLITHHQCNAILCQDYEHARFDACILLGRRLKLPVFATFQGGNWQMGKLEKWIRPGTLKRCAGLIVASGIEQERLKNRYKIPKGKIEKIFNPVSVSIQLSQNEARKKLSLPEKVRIAIWHGRVDYYRKGLDVLLDAWEKVCLQLGEEQTILVLLGTGVDAGLLQHRLKQSELRNIYWIDKYSNDRQQIYTYLKAADLYVFPSRNEGFPVAPLEAMACGLPLVASDAPGIADILKSGEKSGGIMVPREEVNTLAEAIIDLFRDREKRAELGRRAAVNIEQNFSLPAVGKKLYQFLFRENYVG